MGKRDYSQTEFVDLPNLPDYTPYKAPPRERTIYLVTDGEAIWNAYTSRGKAVRVREQISVGSSTKWIIRSVTLIGDGA